MAPAECALCTATHFPHSLNFGAEHGGLQPGNNQVKPSSARAAEPRSAAGEYHYEHKGQGCSTGTLCARLNSLSVTCFHVLWSLGPQTDLQISPQIPKSTDSFRDRVISSKRQIESWPPGPQNLTLSGNRVDVNVFCSY